MDGNPHLPTDQFRHRPYGPIAAGHPVQAKFFHASPYPILDGSGRITDFDEKSIVRWLMLSPFSREIVFDELGLPPNSLYRSEVAQPFYAPGEGDIDLVLCPAAVAAPRARAPMQARESESVNADQDRINKLRDVAGGVRQANKFYNGPFAFFQTYLAIITEAEASAQYERNIPNRGVRSHSTPQRGDTRTTTFRQIVEFPGRTELAQGVGIVFIEIAQPSRVSIDRQASVRVCVYHPAERRDQCDAVTNRVMEIMQ